MTALEPVQTGALSPIHDADELEAAWLLGYQGSTLRAYRSDLRAFKDWLAEYDVPILEAHRAHVDGYVRTLEAGGAKPATIRRKLAALSGFYSYAVDEGLVDRTPVNRVQRPRATDDTPRFGLARDELTRLLAETRRSGPRNYALACLLALNGLRITEAIGSNIGDLSTARGHRTLTITRKGGRRALVPLAPVTSAAIDAMLCEVVEAGPDSPLFQTSTGKRLDRHAARKMLMRAARRVGIEKQISPHSLRHTFVTMALDAGASLRDVQDAAGHRDPRTTRGYDRDRGSLDRHPTYRLAGLLPLEDEQ